MFTHRDAAPVVADDDAIAFLEPQFDPRRVPGHGFVHRVVEHFGHEMVQRAVVGPADIHARTPPDRFEPLEDLDRGSVVIAAGRGRVFEQIVGHAAGIPL